MHISREENSLFEINWFIIELERWLMTKVHFYNEKISSLFWESSLHFHFQTSPSEISQPSQKIKNKFLWIERKFLLVIRWGLRGEGVARKLVLLSRWDYLNDVWHSTDVWSDFYLEFAFNLWSMVATCVRDFMWNCDVYWILPNLRIFKF